jgi:glutamine amidotransferase
VHEHYLPGLIHHTTGESPTDVEAAQKEVDLRNMYYNTDGFGVAWYTNIRSKYEPEFTQGPRPGLYKTVAPPITDAAFTYICANTDSKTIFAHVRAASAPPVVETNNHPFIFGRHTFMHNGGVTNFPKIRQLLISKISPENVAWIKGNTDTEHVAALYFTHLGDTSITYPVGKMRDALAAAIRDIQEAQKVILSPADLANSANSLNLCTTDGEQMVAVRWRNSPTQQPPSLYVSTIAGIILNRTIPNDVLEEGTAQDVLANIGSARDLVKDTLDINAHGHHVIVASEPTTFHPAAWKLLDKNDCITVDKHMKMTVGPLKV